MSERDDKHLSSALKAARKALGCTAPNPAVAALLFDESGRQLAEGVTQSGGRPHAEIEALSRLLADQSPYQACVTLEPCAHEGETQPCAEALVKAGVKRLAYICDDPDPRVSGKGAEMLRKAGVEVLRSENTSLREEAIRLNCGFFSRVKRGRPWVQLKLATSLDGRSALANGHSRWITGLEARQHSHRFRARTDAMLVGANTVLADNPQLTNRSGEGNPNPKVVVLDPEALCGAKHFLFSGKREGATWRYHGPDLAPARTSALDIPFSLEDGYFDLSALLSDLAKRGLTRILVESGGQLAAALWQEEFVDEVIHYFSTCYLGSHSQPAFAALRSPSLEVERSRIDECLSFGSDAMLRFLSPSGRAFLEGLAGEI